MPTSVRSMNESWLISRTQPDVAGRRRSEAWRRRIVDQLLPRSATVSTWAGDRPPLSPGPRAVEQRRERVGMRKALDHQTARLDVAPSRRSTTAPAARRSPTAGRDSICSNIEPSSCCSGNRNLPAAGPASSNGAPADSSTTSGRRRTDSSSFSELHQLLFEPLEVDVVALERLDDQPFGGVEERRRLRWTQLTIGTSGGSSATSVSGK